METTSKGNRLKASLGTAADKLEKPIEWVIHGCGWSSIISVVAIFFFIFREAWPIIPQLDWAEFFGSTQWRPNPSTGNEAHYGALALIVGNFAVAICSMLMAVPFGLGAAIYVSEFAGPKSREWLKVAIEVLAAIPSIVWGFIGLTIISPILIKYAGAELGTNLLNGSIILALMSVPLIVSISEDALRAVPDSYREAALALGANRWEMVSRVLFPAAKNGLLAACMLGVGRAIGETMAVLLATGNTNQIPHSLVDPIKTLTATIASEMGESPSGGAHYQVLFVIGILLLIITCSINLIADFIIKGAKSKANA
ncbi:MAG: phosphate ABC transporter permease subunit PstC [Verrucomicrobiales bacterium]